MNSDNTAHLVTMLNQIAMNMQHGCSEEEAVKKVTQHLTSFWAKSMRENITEHRDSINADLLPVAQKALSNIALAL